MSKVALTPALLSATGWFIGMLFVMCIVTALFAFVLVIALKPVKKYESDENDMSKKLERRETELTIELLKTSNDPQRTEALLKELREVVSAEKLVNRINEEESKADKSAEGGKQAQKKAPQKKALPAQGKDAVKTAKPQRPAPQNGQQRPVQQKPAQQPAPQNGQQRPAPQKPAQQPAPQNGQQRPVQQKPAQQPAPQNGQQRPVQQKPAQQPAPQNGQQKPAPQKPQDTANKKE